jgi:hypothetical protein
MRSCLVAGHARNGSRGCPWLGPLGPRVWAAWLMAVRQPGGNL